MKIIKQIIAGSLTIMSLLTFNLIRVSAAWKQDNLGWWYTEGDSWITGWKTIDGKSYYFYPSGYMAHDRTIDGTYLSSDGSASVTTALTNQNAINTNPLTKQDFEITDNNDNKINLIDSWNNVPWANRPVYIGEVNESKNKTYRGIKLRDSLNDVLNKYGNTTVGVIGKFDFFHNYPNCEQNPATKVVTYNYYENDTTWGGFRCSYNLKFYFNNSDQVVLMVYVKNQNMNSNIVYNK